MKRGSSAGAARGKRRMAADESSSGDDTNPQVRDARLRLQQKRIINSATFYDDQATLLRGHKFPATYAALSRDNTSIVSVDKGGHVVLHDLATGARSSLPQLTRKPLTCAAFLSTTLFATAGIDGFVRVFDRRTHALARTISTRTPILSLAPPTLAGPNEHLGRCFIADADGCITVSDAAVGTTIDTLYGHVGPIPSVHALTEGTAVSGGGGDHTVRLWRPAQHKQILFAETPAASLDAVAMLTPTLVLAGGNAGELYLFHTARRRPIWAVRGGAHGYESVTAAGAFGMDKVWVEDPEPDGADAGDGAAAKARRNARLPTTRAAQQVHASLAREAAAAAAAAAAIDASADAEDDAEDEAAPAAARPAVNRFAAITGKRSAVATKAAAAKAAAAAAGRTDEAPTATTSMGRPAKRMARAESTADAPTTTETAGFARTPFGVLVPPTAAAAVDLAAATTATAAAAGVYGHFEVLPEVHDPPRHARWITAIAGLMASNCFLSGSSDGRVRMWAPPIPFVNPTPIASDASHIIGSFAAPGVVNSLAVSDGVGVTSDAGVAIACVSKEPRLGRWWRDKSATDGVLIVPFKVEASRPTE